MRSFPKVAVKWNLAKRLEKKVYLSHPFTWQRFFFFVEGTLKWWLQNDTSHIQRRLCRALVLWSFWMMEIRWVFVLLVNWSPLPKNLAVQQYVTEILKIKRKKKGFLCKTCMKPHVSSVNMNRVIQTENPLKWCHDFFLSSSIYSIHSTSISEKKRSGKNRTPGSGTQLSRNSCSSLFCGNVRFKKKSQLQFSRLDFWTWLFSSPLKTSQGELARLASVLVQSGPKNQL